jgi:hypothetical protein
MTVAEHDIAIGPWMRALIRSYLKPPPPPPRSNRLVIVGAVIVAIGAALAPILSHLNRAAYPAEPEKRLALDQCSRSDPTFLRFLSADRTACYERVLSVVHAAAEK